MKVLIAAPTSNRHDYVIDEWFECLKKQTFKDFDVLLINTKKDDDYAKKLRGHGARVLENIWDPEKANILVHLANVREQYRKVAVNEGYDYLFNLDTDILLPVDGVEELIGFDKDQVGFVVHVFPKTTYQPPCVFKHGRVMMNQDNPKRNGLGYYSWSWVSKYRGQLKRVYGTGLGVLLVKRKVFLEVPFRTHPTFRFGEDLWYYAEADDKGFESWCYVKRVPHLNANWDEITKEEKSVMRMCFAFGKTDATKAKWVN